jgi:hypothetical protein
METPEEKSARMQAIYDCLERHKQFEADPAAWPDFLRCVAAGETPGHACERLGLNLFELNAWIRRDPDTTAETSRRGMMDEALVSRSESIKWGLEDQLQAISAFDPRKLFKDGQLIPVDQWPTDVAMAIAGLDVEDMFEQVNDVRTLVGYLKKYKAWDKLKGIDMLGKQHGQFKDKTSERIADSLESLLAKSFKASM